MAEKSTLLSTINNAFELVKKGQDKEAAQEFESALSVVKERATVRDISYQLSQCYLVLNELDKTEKYLKMAQDNCLPDETSILQEIYDMQILVYKALGRSLELAKVYEDIINTKDLDEQYYIAAVINLCNRYFNEEKYNEALKVINKGLEIYSDNKKLISLRIKSNRLLDNYAESMREGLEYVDKYGFDIEAYLAIGVGYCFYKNPKDSFRYFRAAYENIFGGNDSSQYASAKTVMLLTTTMLSGSLYHDECEKELLLDILRKRYEITSGMEKNTVFARDYGFFRRLRIGYLSADLKAHPVGQFITPVILNRNTCHSTNVCYSVTKHEELDNPISNYLMESAKEWHDLFDKSDDEIEIFVLENKPDILLELASLTKGNKLELYARRLAPLQVSWIGFPISTGVKAVDYVITDKYCDPPGIAEEYYTEKLLYLPDTFLCNLSTYKNEPSTLPFDQNGYITFGCFNNGVKITDDMLRCWNKILRGVEGSRILLKSDYYDNKKAFEAIKERMLGAGIDLNRVDFEGSSLFSDYLDKYNSADIMLDTFPFNGATTTFEAFLMGAPLVALIGETHVARVSLCMLTNVGLEDLATYTEEDYINTAIKLAGDVERLRILKSTLRDITLKSKLADADSFRAEYEYAMRRIWIEYCKKNRKHAAYGGLSIGELSDSLVNGAFYMRKLISDTGEAVSDEALLNEYISLQRVFMRKLEKLWKDKEEMTKPLETCKLISNSINRIKSQSASDMDELLLANTRFVKHYTEQGVI